MMEIIQETPKAFTFNRVLLSFILILINIIKIINLSNYKLIVK